MAKKSTMDMLTDFDNLSKKRAKKKKKKAVKKPVQKGKK